MKDELEPEILSYREFRNRQALRAWEERRRALEAQPGRARVSLRGERDAADWYLAPHGAASPPRAPNGASTCIKAE
jgi:hypothetical protein